MPIDKASDLAELSLKYFFIIRNQGTPYDCLRPAILFVNFCNRNIEFSMQSVNERFNDTSFFLQGSAGRNQEVKSDCAKN